MASETIIQGDHANIAEQALMFRRYWNQEKTRAEKLDGDNRFLRRELDEARAAVAELVEALERIRDLSPAVTHGWAVDVRNIATTALSRHQAGLGKGEDRG